MLLLPILGSWKYMSVVASNIISSILYLNKIHAVIFKWNTRAEREADKINFILLFSARVSNDGH